jgi:hypothetical protein
MEPKRVKARRIEISGILLIIAGIVLIFTGSIGMVFIAESMALGEGIIIGFGIFFLIIGGGLLGWSRKELRIEKRKEKMERRNQSIGLSLFGGILGIIIGIYVGCCYWGGISKTYMIIYILPCICLSIISIVGAILELKNLMIGSLVSLISGIAIVITLNIYIIAITIYLFPPLLIIVGGMLGIWEARKAKKS